MTLRKDDFVECRVTKQVLQDLDLQQALKALCGLMEQAMGPQGTVIPITNSIGGPVTFTTSCSRLLQAMSCTRPVIKLVVAAVESHLHRFGDGGLLTSVLCLRLILNALNMDQSIGMQSVIKVYKLMLSFAEDIFKGSNSPVVPMDMSRLSFLLTYIRCILTSKPACMLRPEKAEFLSQLVLKAFLMSLPDSTIRSYKSDRLVIVGIDGRDVFASSVFDGILLTWPEHSFLYTESDDVQYFESSTCVRVALVSVSMSGDVDDELLSCETEASPFDVSSVSDAIMKDLLGFCDQLHKDNVKLLFCQKVIHPYIKTYIHSLGIIFMDRLGLSSLRYVEDLAGATVICSVLVLPSIDVYGLVNSARCRLIHRKAYLHLQRHGSCVCSFFLYAPFDEQLAEIKVVVQSALNSLCSLLRRPATLCGGGCWQTELVCHLAQKICRDRHIVCERLHITLPDLHKASSAFCSSVIGAARSLVFPQFAQFVDLKYGHTWNVPPGFDFQSADLLPSCSCGRVRHVANDNLQLQPISSLDSFWATCVYRDDVNCEMMSSVLIDGELNDVLLDSVECVTNALRTAVCTASAVLSVAIFIGDS